MKVQDKNFILQKIEKYLAEDIVPGRYREIMEIEAWKYHETAMDEPINDAYGIDYNDRNWSDFKPWDTWGGYDKSAWFRTTVKIPQGMRGKQLVIKLVPGPRDGGDCTAEALLYINGNPVQGVDVWHEEVLLEESLCREETLHLALKAWSGVLAPPRFRTFKQAQLIWLDRTVDEFYFMADTVLRSAKLLQTDDLRRIRLTKLLNETFKRISFLNMGEPDYYQSIYTAHRFLKEELDRLAGIDEIKPRVFGVGHSHIDMAWLWRLNATREKAARTFSTVLNLMKQYPEYHYMHSSPQLYQFLKADYPEIFARVKEKIAQGQWEITGGMWVEPDTNVPSGESLVRQFLYGKRCIREEFSRETTLVWLPDVFGYSAALPQIMKKSGMKYFMTTKISWNQYNHFPYDTFMWKGIDGSEIFTHFITTPEDGSWYYTYNGHMDPEEVTGIWTNYKDKEQNDELLIAFGWGDGGGGPTREMLERSRVMKNLPGIPQVEMTTAEGYFERIYEHTEHQALGKWEGELYFEFHRGTYTSQAANKRYNRMMENMLHNLEYLAAAADIATKDSRYPESELNKIWERVLLNQFHDILPGSSIRQVYEDTTKDYQMLAGQLQALTGEAKERFTSTVQTASDSVMVMNTTGFIRADYVCIPYGGFVGKGSRFTDENGPLHAQDTEAGVLVYVTGIPAYGYKTIALAGAPLTGGNDENDGNDGNDGKEIILDSSGAENRFYIIKFNENGEISYLYDKENQREVSCGQPMNVFTAYEDKPQRFDAWDIDVYYKEKPYSPFERIQCQVIEAGNSRSVLRQVWKFNQSTLTQDLILYGDSRRIDFKTTVDWKEKQVFLKTYFPVDVHSQEATYEIQFGNIRRPTHTNNEWDFARFEVSGHRYADLSEGAYGVSVLNDCKYGWDIHENVIGLSLIKSAVKPDETADRRIHEFTYSLYPHRGNVIRCGVQQEALNLNIPLLTSFCPAAPGGREYAGYSLVSTPCDHILIDTVKKAMDDDGYILRLYEFENKAEKEITLSFSEPIKKIVETNLCEEGEATMYVQDNQIRFDVGCFEIKTFKVYI